MRTAPASRRTRSGPPRVGARGLLSVLAAGVLCLLPAAPAAAHVLIETVEPNGDGTTTLTFTFDHGCEGEPTHMLHVTMPDGVEALAADQPGGWTADVGPGYVHWQGDPVPDGDRAEFTLDVRVTGTVGQSFSFPTEQGCPSGAAYEWTDTDPTAAHPAPTFVATAATLADTPAPAATDPAGTSQVGTLPLIAGIVATAVAAGAGGGWAARRRIS
ncbi:DUF1775 domain-containing protein [Myceligenerans pegani]|uniref:DUF1775 domain-containing protein n=1 Tax=Myceligenerans pegani TaxID=2776917 RepID=A0ABR9MW88_9MICO|nr:DUF1775 domain-containing protein [Myceligenerans sp. TRM 65318]MBE1875660.1 DUF1775 domain-containing protein [Myceligenerans sp. TRM 65318]MBE3017931.1 DUF1775 domain-containing protein [Myceligenerans sp. TRM 65318]